MALVQCDLTIINLTNLDVDQLPLGKIFFRYSIYAGGGKRIMIETREVVACKNNLCWNEASTLQCQMASESMKDAICAHNVVFELRWRRDHKGILGRVAKSKLLGRAEVAWKDMLGLETDMLVERQVVFVTKESTLATLFLRMGIRVRDLEVREKRRGHYCGCESIGNEEDMFVASSMINAR